MLKPSDLYTYEQTVPLALFGTITIKYELRKYNDVRNLQSALAYLLVCTQRVVVAGSAAYQGPTNNTNYSNYPAVILNTITPTVNNGATAVVKTMFPRTLDAAVSTSVNRGNSATGTSEYQHTSGSSTSTTNTYSLGLSMGWQYDKGKESSKSTMRGNISSQESSISSGDVMSIKDWSSYGSVSGSAITWVWGQMYPWDVLQYNQTDGNTGTNGDPIINLPSFVAQRLLDNSGGTQLVLPPSSLSLYGCDFTMKVGWLIEFPVPDDITSSETVSLEHDMTCYHASHYLNSNQQIVATLQSKGGSGKYTTPQPLDMSTYALDPITSASTKNGAIIGFTTNDFTYGPSGGSEFKIISPANNLQVTGSGFDADPLSTTFAQTPSLTVQFKIIDSVSAYSLLLKHWIGPGSGACQMTFNINGEPVTIYVEAEEGKGAQNNLSVIDLRNLNFASNNSHDYLVLGLNTISVEIVPVDSSNNNNQYTLFALAVGRA